MENTVSKTHSVLMFLSHNKKIYRNSLHHALKLRSITYHIIFSPSYVLLKPAFERVDFVKCLRLTTCFNAMTTTHFKQTEKTCTVPTRDLRPVELLMFSFPHFIFPA